LKPFSSGGWSLPATHFTSIYHITALHIPYNRFAQPLCT